jgi:hypothetical protein
MRSGPDSGSTGSLGRAAIGPIRVIRPARVAWVTRVSPAGPTFGSGNVNLARGGPTALSGRGWLLHGHVECCQWKQGGGAAAFRKTRHVSGWVLHVWGC